MKNTNKGIREIMKEELGVSLTGSSANNGCALITGYPNQHKRDFVSAMIRDSHERGNNTVVIENVGCLPPEAFGSHFAYSVPKDRTHYCDVFSKGFPFNLVAINKNDDIAHIEKQLTEKLAATGEYSIRHLDDIGKLVHSYVREHNEELRKNGWIDVNALQNILSVAERHNNNDPDELERINTLCEDLSSCGFSNVLENEYFHDPHQLKILQIDSGCLSCAPEITDMLLVDIIHYQNQHRDVHLDVYVDDISNLNYSFSGPIGRIIRDAAHLNMSFIGISKDYYPRYTDRGEVLCDVENTYFLYPTPTSKQAVYDELGIIDEKDWPFDYLNDNIVVLKRRHNDITGGSTCTIFGGVPEEFYTEDEEY